jgi:hypothetical protein
VLVQVDVTRNDEGHRALLKRFRLFGPPGIIFFDAEGRELDTRVVGFQNAERFGKSLDAVLASAASASPQGIETTPAAAVSSTAPGVPSAALSQKLRGLDREVREDAVAAGALERQQ